MPYVIEASVRQAGGAAPVGTYTLEASRQTIGRGADCGVPLDDKKKYVSREHAVLDFSNGVCAVTVLSKVNPVIVNGERVNPGASVPVKSGDVLDIGEFRLKLLEVSPLSETVPEPEAAEPEVTIDITSSFEAPVVAPVAVDDAIFAEPTFVGERPKDLALGKAPEAAVEAPPVSDAEDVDESIFAEPTFVGQRPEGIDFGKPAAAPAAPPPEDAAIFSEPTFMGDAPEALAKLALGNAPQKAAAADIKVLDESTVLGARLKELQALKKAKPAPSDEAPSGVAAPRSGGADTGLLAAFLDGAGLSHLDVPQDQQEAFLRECGSIVRASVDGLVGLLLARSEMKKEMRTEERTMVSSRNNNPLKLIADPKEAVAFLFEPGARATAGFLPPVQAVEDACKDLRAHEIALMAGLRSALLGSLKRFDPELLEKIAGKQKGAFSLNKKVKLWDTFVEYQKKMTLDAEDDFLKVFGREFLGTYQAQVRKLQK
ncbi:MAG: type VI secretion system-associated FHA domain protein TagH [Proteobacteria bacterium]|nr:type VI secretion system-associated FHA domain protein TagH [Pseudomonadota bacterium]